MLDNPMTGDQSAFGINGLRLVPLETDFTEINGRLIYDLKVIFCTFDYWENHVKPKRELEQIEFEIQCKEQQLQSLLDIERSLSPSVSALSMPLSPSTSSRMCIIDSLNFITNVNTVVCLFSS